jgi:hypothetical protein
LAFFCGVWGNLGPAVAPGGSPQPGYAACKCCRIWEWEWELRMEKWEWEWEMGNDFDFEMRNGKWEMRNENENRDREWEYMYSVQPRLPGLLPYYKRLIGHIYYYYCYFNNFIDLIWESRINISKKTLFYVFLIS